MKRILSFILSAGLILSLAACEKATTNSETIKPEPKEVLQTQEPEQPPENSVTTPTEEAEPEKVYNYDALQTVFMAMTEDTTTEELWNLILEHNLSVTAQENNGGTVIFGVAYTEGVARQKYADSGDYLNVTFDVLGDNYMSNDNRLKSVKYVNDSWFWACFFTDRAFDGKVVEDYSGYYIEDSFAKEDGITIKYTNGHESVTNYFRYDSAEEVIQKMIDGTR